MLTTVADDALSTLLKMGMIPTTCNHTTVIKAIKQLLAHLQKEGICPKCGIHALWMDLPRRLYIMVSCACVQPCKLGAPPIDPMTKATHFFLSEIPSVDTCVGLQWTRQDGTVFHTCV